MAELESCSTLDFHLHLIEDDLHVLQFHVYGIEVGLGLVHAHLHV